MPHTADERLRNQLEHKLASHGIRPPCKVVVGVRNGQVTLSGTVQFDYQKRAAAHACRAMSGVKGVVDQIQVAAHKSPWAANPSQWAVHSRTSPSHAAAAGRNGAAAGAGPGQTSHPPASSQTAS
jgi:hypothetical protein